MRPPARTNQAWLPQPSGYALSEGWTDTSNANPTVMKCQVRLDPVQLHHRKSVVDNHPGRLTGDTLPQREMAMSQPSPARR
jgi:hypothetical protein